MTKGEVYMVAKIIIFWIGRALFWSLELRVESLESVESLELKEYEELGLLFLFRLGALGIEPFMRDQRIVLPLLMSDVRESKILFLRILHQTMFGAYRLCGRPSRDGSLILSIEATSKEHQSYNIA